VQNTFANHLYDADPGWLELLRAGMVSGGCYYSPPPNQETVGRWSPFSYTWRPSGATVTVILQQEAALGDSYFADIRLERLEPATCGGNAKGAPCTFPFRYKRVDYSSCTMADHTEPWCYVDAGVGSFGGKWGNCLCSDVYNWVVSSWGSCLPVHGSICGLAFQTRSVECISNTGRVMVDSACEGSKPVSELECFSPCAPMDIQLVPRGPANTSIDAFANASLAPTQAVQYFWTVSVWSPCRSLSAALCSASIQERTVECLSAAGVFAPSDIECGTKRPNRTQDCYTPCESTSQPTRSTPTPTLLPTFDDDMHVASNDSSKRCALSVFQASSFMSPNPNPQQGTTEFQFQITCGAASLAPTSDWRVLCASSNIASPCCSGGGKFQFAADQEEPKSGFLLEPATVGDTITCTGASGNVTATGACSFELHGLVSVCSPLPLKPSAEVTAVAPSFLTESHDLTVVIALGSVVGAIVVLLCAAVLYGKFVRKASVHVATTNNAIAVQPRQFVAVAGEPVTVAAAEPVTAIPVAIHITSGIPVAEPMIFRRYTSATEFEMYELAGPSYGPPGRRLATPEPAPGMPSRPGSADALSGTSKEERKQVDRPGTAESPFGNLITRPGAAEWNNHAADARTGARTPEATKQVARPGTAEYRPGTRPSTADSGMGGSGSRISPSSQNTPCAWTEHDFLAITPPVGRWLPDSGS
jgi:hypothetical protein